MTKEIMAVALPQSQRGCYYCKFPPYVGLWEATSDPSISGHRETLGYYHTKEQALHRRKGWEEDRQ